MIKDKIVMYTSLIIIAVCFFSLTGIAYEVPKDAVIKVYTKSGKQIGEMSRADYKVVKIKKVKTTVEPYIIYLKKDVPVFIKDKNKHDVILQVGVGNKGLDVDKNSVGYEVREDRKTIMGATYCYSPEEQSYDMGWCGSIMSNDSYMTGLKIGF